MKKIIAALIGALISTFIYGQQDWNTAGNVVALPNNIFGTTNNFPIRYFSNNVQRMWLNSNVTNNINGQGLENRHGFLGLGPNYTGAPAGTFNGTGPISVLHIAGEGNASGTGGYRNWMRYGISLTHNNDLMFVGQRRFGTGFDVTDAVIAWADNPGSPSDFGPDNLVFNFVSGQLPSGANADLDGTASNGREVMRLNSNGNVGMGPRFNNWNQPQSDLHINRDAAQPVWLQMSYQNLFPGANPLPNSSQYSASRGLRIGFNNAVGYIFNQENSHLIFSTNASTVTQLALERMRISHVGAPGIPATAANGSTRVAVSLTPTSPLTAPRSLMHIGAPLSGQAGSTDGVRNWMNVGYLSTFDSDNMYVGLKNEGADRQDAVIAWGDNQTDLINGSGPDNLRFIFANSQFSLSPGTPEAKSDNGQEIGRFTPACATCPVNTGSFGIGNYSPSIIQNGNIVNNPNGPDSAGYIGATLDVNGDARIRTVQLDNSLNQVLVRDSNDLGRIYWRDAATLGGGTGLGNDCGAAPNPLLADRQIPLANFDLYFTGQSLPSVGNTVNIGLNCGNTLTGKLNVIQDSGSPVNESTDAGNFLNLDIGTVIGLRYIGVRGQSIGVQTLPKIINVGGHFFAESSTDPTGVYGEAGSATNFHSYGGDFLANSSSINGYGIRAVSNSQIRGVGVQGASTSASEFNTGGEFFANGIASNTNTGVVGSALGAPNNIGGAFSASYPTSFTPGTKVIGAIGRVGNTSATYPSDVALGIYGAATAPNVLVNSFAGYFDGDVFINGPTNGTGFALVSDQQFKTDIQEIQNASQLISQLQPKEYNFVNGENLGIDLPSEHQYGFIAQEVEAVLPEFVHNVIKPATVDSLGNIVKPKVEYKSLNYIGFIALLMQDAKEKEQKIAQLESKYLALNQQIAELSSKIDGCCNTPRNQQESYITPAGAVIQTNLRNAEEPTLGQNIPNPFEYQTRIPLFLPNSISKAELIFYGNDGKILQNILVADRGTVQVEVNADALAAGIYSYTLFVDGRPVDTKRMIKN